MDKAALVVGSVFSGLAGAAFPLMGTLMGGTMDAFYPVYNESKVCVGGGVRGETWRSRGVKQVSMAVCLI